MELAKPLLVLSWICRVAASAILLQTLYFKFSGAPESVYIFKTVGLEPWGRIGTGVAELIAAGLLLFSPWPWLGAGLATGIMAGAILSHLTLLGISVQGDGGLLFGLAIVVTVCSLAVLFLHRNDIPFLNTLWK